MASCLEFTLRFYLLFLLLHMIILLLALQCITYYKTFSDIVAGEGPLPGPERGFCLTLGNELSEETHMLTKQETLLGRGAQAERRAGGSGNPGELLCHVARSLRFYDDGISFPVVSGQSL